MYKTILKRGLSLVLVVMFVSSFSFSYAFSGFGSSRTQSNNNSSSSVSDWSSLWGNSSWGGSSTNKSIGNTTGSKASSNTKTSTKTEATTNAKLIINDYQNSNCLVDVDTEFENIDVTVKNTTPTSNNGELRKQITFTVDVTSTKQHTIADINFWPYLYNEASDYTIVDWGDNTKERLDSSTPTSSKDKSRKKSSDTGFSKGFRLKHAYSKIGTYTVTISSTADLETFIDYATYQDYVDCDITLLDISYITTLNYLNCFSAKDNYIHFRTTNDALFKEAQAAAEAKKNSNRETDNNIKNGELIINTYQNTNCVDDSEFKDIDITVKNTTPTSNNGELRKQLTFTINITSTKPQIIADIGFWPYLYNEASDYSIVDWGDNTKERLDSSTTTSFKDQSFRLSSHEDSLRFRIAHSYSKTGTYTVTISSTADLQIFINEAAYTSANIDPILYPDLASYYESNITSLDISNITTLETLSCFPTEDNYIRFLTTNDALYEDAKASADAKKNSDTENTNTNNNLENEDEDEDENNKDIDEGNSNTRPEFPKSTNTNGLGIIPDYDSSIISNAITMFGLTDKLSSLIDLLSGNVNINSLLDMLGNSSGLGSLSGLSGNTSGSSLFNGTGLGSGLFGGTGLGSTPFGGSGLGSGLFGRSGLGGL